jgi:hypothetical protein
MNMDINPAIVEAVDSEVNVQANSYDVVSDKDIWHWISLIENHTDYAVKALREPDDFGMTARDRLIQIAAQALIAIEVFDEKFGPTHSWLRYPY